MDSLNKREILHTDLRHWFEGEKRFFPWRINPNPYRVWISEVMLQQTVASTVVPFFEKFMRRFPSIEALANAPIDDLLKIWEGLGYYSRARSLHEGANYILENHGGKLPPTEADLSKIKGLGPYTIGAIRSFAFHKKAAAVDGNVSRVMSRLYYIEEEIDSSRVARDIREKVEDLLPDSEPWVIMEALIELGAKVCKPKPRCGSCPIQDGCKAYLLGKEATVPRKKSRAKVTMLKRKVFVVHFKGAFLLRRVGEKQVMAGLYEFPFTEHGDEDLFCDQVKQSFQLKEVKHTFTRYRAHLKPSVWEASHHFSFEGYRWIEGKKLNELPFSSGHRRILKQLLEDHADLTY